MVFPANQILRSSQKACKISVSTFDDEVSIPKREGSCVNTFGYASLPLGSNGSSHRLVLWSFGSRLANSSRLLRFIKLSV